MSMLPYLREILTEQDWPFQEHPELPIVRVEIEGENGDWEAYVELRDEAQQFLVYSVYSVDITPDLRASLAELLHRINCGLVIGCFELDYEDDAVRLRTSADMTVTPPSRALAERLVVGNTLIMDLHLPSIEAVASGDMSVNEAMAAKEALD